ncbi:ribonuclease H-like domain-containing protein [Candidatus Woesearchaeota archaeon]|nr:ribonuclease H-like domain-containing protein [Candidatus Woesearchaeota archaeon]HIH37709.1 exonuclease [Candidatus Woesearchaeota archaeon]HIH48254.1 exonuclease [Candidatus Woesearchaeota archaeon]HIJ03262.1 exonuclease [Candidatus Woesearchaeota archaeon]
MIQHTFQFLDGIGPGKEARIKAQGIGHWDDFLAVESIDGVQDGKKPYFDRKVKEAKQHLHSGNTSFFSQVLPKQEHWRLYNHFKEDAVFLDIETTGLSWRDEVTVVGLYDGINTKMMIKGINLDYTLLKKELQRYKMMISFNGITFDVPFLNKQFPGVVPSIPHFDLRFGCKKIGYSGGLKAIEPHFGIKRRDLVHDLHGGDAVLLWKMYRATGDEHYLNLLIEYNEEDIINLKKIADTVYKKLAAGKEQKENNC